VNIHDEITFSAWDSDFGKDEKMGDGKIDLATIQSESKVEFGKNFTHDKWFLLDNCQSPTARIHLKFTMKYLSVLESQKKEAEQAQKETKKEKSILNLLAPKKSSKGNSALGNPQRRNCQLRCRLYQARNLPALDSNGLADPYVIMRCAGKKLNLEEEKRH